MCYLYNSANQLITGSFFLKLFNHKKMDWIGNPSSLATGSQGQSLWQGFGGKYKGSSTQASKSALSGMWRIFWCGSWVIRAQGPLEKSWDLVHQQFYHQHVITHRLSASVIGDNAHWTVFGKGYRKLYFNLLNIIVTGIQGPENPHCLLLRARALLKMALKLRGM